MSELLETIFRMSAALILLMSSGMHTGWTTLKINVTESWMHNASFFLFVIAHASWFIGVIVGLSLSLLLIRHLGTKQLEWLAISLFMLNGISLSIFSDTAEIVTTAQIIGGIGSGINLINFLTLNSEISHKSYRGRLSYLGMILFLSGMLIFLFINSYLYYQNDVLFFVGALTIADSCVALGFSVAGTKPNPSYLYFKISDSQNEEDNRKVKMAELITDEEHVSELNIYFNDTTPNRIRKQQACILLINLINVLVYNYMTNYVVLYVIYVASSNHYEWIAPTLFMIRICGCIFGYCKIDVWGRRIFIFVSGLGIFLAILFATISYLLVHDHEFSDYFWVPAIFFIVLQFFYGLNAGLQITVASEIFPFVYRLQHIVFIEIVKHFLLILILFLRFYLTSSLFMTLVNISLFVSAFGTLVATILLYIIMPELKNLSLQECVDSFKIKINGNYCVWMKS